MNKYQKEYIQKNIADEEEVLKEIKKVYRKAESDISHKIARLMKEMKRAKESDIQSKIWQIKYQRALLKQVEDAINKINDYDSIMDYLEKCYECGWYGVLYDL